MKVYLIAHGNGDEKGTGVHQAKILAKNDADARKQFKERHPKREIHLTGTLGVS